MSPYLDRPLRSEAQARREVEAKRCKLSLALAARRAAVQEISKALRNAA